MNAESATQWEEEGAKANIGLALRGGGHARVQLEAHTLLFARKGINVLATSSLLPSAPTA